MQLRTTSFDASRPSTPEQHSVSPLTRGCVHADAHWKIGPGPAGCTLYLPPILAARWTRPQSGAGTRDARCVASCSACLVRSQCLHVHVDRPGNVSGEAVFESAEIAPGAYSPVNCGRIWVWHTAARLGEWRGGAALCEAVRGVCLYTPKRTFSSMPKRPRWMHCKGKPRRDAPVSDTRAALRFVLYQRSCVGAGAPGRVCLRVRRHVAWS